MIFYVVGYIFLILAFCALWVRKQWFQPTAFALYGFASLIIGFIQTSQSTPMFMIRYFLYVISGFVVFFIPSILVVMALIIIVGMIRHRGQSVFYYVKNSIIAGAFLMFVVFLVWATLNLEQLYLDGFINMMILLTLYFIATFLSFIVLNILIHLWPSREKPTILIILGQKLEDERRIPSILVERLDYALNYYEKQSAKTQRQMYFVVTGGASQAGIMSEAEGMRRYLLENGVPSNQIITESKAQNTRDNFKHSLLKIREHHLEGHILVITSRFHLMRSHYLAWESGLEVRFKGASTPLWIWPYYLVRDFLAYIMINREFSFLYIVFVVVMGITEVFGG